MSAVSLKHLRPKPLHIAVLYALAEMRAGPVIRDLEPTFHAAHGWRFG